MFDLITESGISVVEAIQGVMDVGESSYNVRRIVAENWSKMPILSWKDIIGYKENPKINSLIIEDIIRANELGITADTFVTAQEAIFTRNINPNKKQ